MNIELNTKYLYNYKIKKNFTWNKKIKMYNEIYFPRDNIAENDSQDQSKISIYREDLIMLKNLSARDLPDEIVLNYAKRLGFDIINDPPELLDIAKKYLLKPLPDHIVRAVHKENLEILYVNEITEEVFLKLDIDNECQKEYEKEKEKILKEKNNKKKKKKRQKEKKQKISE